MSQSPVQVYGGQGTLAQSVLASAPEGMLIAPAWKRAAAFAIDALLITIVLAFLTGGVFATTLNDLSLLTQGAKSIAFFLVNWLILFMAGYLYFKYTGRSFGRSLGQRGFRIAIVHDNGTALEQHHWGPRAIAKLAYFLPFIGWFLFGLRDVMLARSGEGGYRTKIDQAHHTVAAVDWSLPSETRLKLK